MSAERTDEQVVKEKWPDAWAQIYTAGFNGNLAARIVTKESREWLGSGRTMAEAWANAAKRLKARKLSKAEKEMYGCDG